MIHAATPAERTPLRLEISQPLVRRRAALQGWFGRRIRPELQHDGKPYLFWGLSRSDIRDFMMAYTACFVAVIGFFA